MKQGNKEREGINPNAKPTGTGCVECLETDGWWLHLHRCTQCGHIGCCDNSPNQHATKHNVTIHHPIITSSSLEKTGSMTTLQVNFLPVPS